MPHLRAIHLPQPAPAGTYPFNIPALQALDNLTLTTPVTFFVGENGSGKSTLLEAIGIAAGLPTAGSEGTAHDPTLAAVRPLADRLKLVWNRRTRRGFFLRAEDFFGYVKQLAHMRAELERDLAATKEAYKDRSELAQGLARMPLARELHALQNQYDRDLNTFSHGESFLEFFQARVVPNGLYILDEPEVPLSPMRQLALLALMKQIVAENGQFLIATHSPILMAFPDATILSFDEQPPRPVAYDDLEHVTLTRLFLNNPEQFLRHL